MVDKNSSDGFPPLPFRPIAGLAESAFVPNSNLVNLEWFRALLLDTLRVAIAVLEQDQTFPQSQKRSRSLSRASDSKAATSPKKRRKPLPRT